MLYDKVGQQIAAPNHFINEKAREQFLTPLVEKLDNHKHHGHGKMFQLGERANVTQDNWQKPA